MPQPQLINITTHVLAGSAAIGLGLFLVATAKGTPQHRRRGRLFAWLTLLVCATAAIGINAATHHTIQPLPHPIVLCILFLPVISSNKTTI